MTADSKETTDAFELFQPGDYVKHSKFGEGQILQKTGSGEDTKFIVSFSEEGEKRLMATFANLKKKNIRFFRLRYKKRNHHIQILVLEPSVFNLQGTGLKNRLLKNLNPSAVINPSKDTRLQYNTRTRKMKLFIFI